LLGDKRPRATLEFLEQTLRWRAFGGRICEVRQVLSLAGGGDEVPGIRAIADEVPCTDKCR
jgi:hypothetical protein